MIQSKYNFTMAGNAKTGRKCQNHRKTLNTREKRKPTCPENHPGETGCLFQNDGGDGSRTHDPVNAIHVL